MPQPFTSSGRRCGLGVAAVSIGQTARWIAAGAPGWRRMLSVGERHAAALRARPAEYVAGRFAVKTACASAMRTRPICWSDITVTTTGSGAPALTWRRPLHDASPTACVSIAHAAGVALAAVAWRLPACALNGVGVDVVDAARVGAWLNRFDTDTLRVVFTEHELRCSRKSDRPGHALAACFALKEAVFKTLSHDARVDPPISWTDIEMRRDAHRWVPRVHHAASTLARRLGVGSWDAWTASRGNCVAVLAIAKGHAQ